MEVMIRETCPQCKGEGYIDISQESKTKEKICRLCAGNGVIESWVEIRDLINLLREDQECLDPETEYKYSRAPRGHYGNMDI